MPKGTLHQFLATLAIVAGVTTASAALGARSPLPTEYLVTALNPKANVNVSKDLFTVEVIDGSGRVMRVVERTGPGSGDARWSADGQMIAWLDSAGLNVENSDGTARRLLVPIPAKCEPECAGLTFAWSPDSRSLAVAGAGGQTNHLVKVDVGTGKETEIAPTYPYTQYEVIGFSPDGSELAFGRASGQAGTASCCKNWLVVAHADGSDQRRLFSFADPIHDGPTASSWSPDSRSIAFTDDGMDHRDPTLGIVDVATGAVHRVPGGNADDAPVWSPDGRRLTLVRYVSGSLYSVNLFDTASGAVTKVGAGSVPIGWYSNGTITTIGGKDDSAVYAISTRDGSERELFSLPRPLTIASITPKP